MNCSSVSGAVNASASAESCSNWLRKSSISGASVGRPAVAIDLPDCNRRYRRPCAHFRGSARTLTWTHHKSTSPLALRKNRVELRRVDLTGAPLASARGRRLPRGTVELCMPRTSASAARSSSWRSGDVRRERARVGAVLRPEQGPVPRLRLQGPEDGKLRHLLLPGGRGRGRAGRRAWPSGGTRGSRACSTTISRRQPLILYASHPHFEQTNVLQGSIGEGTGGVTEVLKRRVVMPLAGPIAETDHVLGHELVHAFQFDMTGGGGRPARRTSRTRCACPCGSSRAWRSTCPSAPSTPTPRCGCATRRGARSCPPSASSWTTRLLPVPVRAGALVLHRRAVGRRGGRSAADDRRGHRRQSECTARSLPRPSTQARAPICPQGGLTT